VSQPTCSYIQCELRASQNLPAFDSCTLSCSSARVLQEVGENLQHISHFARRWVGWTGQQESQQRLAAQQELLDRASHFGQLLGLGVMGVVALRAGRLWEVHQVGRGTCTL
jgi:hypothetical protein